MMNKAMIKGQTLIFILLWVFLLLSVAAPCLASSKYVSNEHPIEINIISDNGAIFTTYPVTQRYLKNEYRAYLEAIYGENYSLQIRNNTNQRLGLVIAVDGRNIISGKQSKLKYSENMYILGPFESQTYSGWRTSSRDIHRFYFTDIEDSYAHAFDDVSAMGVIAVAAFEEKRPFITQREKKQSIEPRAKAPNHTYDSTAGESATMDRAESEAGTGFGDHETSYVRRVHFNAKRTALTKSFYKYEWQETLCQKGIIIDCGFRHKPPKNRFWPHENYEIGFAPYPPR